METDVVGAVTSCIVPIVFLSVAKFDGFQIAMHLLCMCLAKWQTQYNFTEKTTPVNSWALLLILDKIENNAEVEAKPPMKVRGKG